MMRLAELEAAMQAHVLAGGALPAALAQALAPPARCAIYVEAYRLRLIEALATQYPALAARAGRAGFAAVAQAFIMEVPSVHRSIRDYGAELPAHLAAAAGDVEDAMRAELAAFEWRLAAAFDAAPAAATAPGDLAAVAPEEWPELRFRSVASLSRLATHSNAVAVWRAVKAAEVVDGAPVAEPVAERSERVEWLIVRPHLDTEFRSLPGDEAAALDALLAGEPFGALCARLADAGEPPAAAAARAAGWLKGWLLAGALERV